MDRLGRKQGRLGSTGQGATQARERSLHQTVIVVLAYAMLDWPAAIPIKYGVLLCSSLALILAMYLSGIRPWVPMRLLFGMKARRVGVSSARDRGAVEADGVASSVRWHAACLLRTVQPASLRYSGSCARMPRGPDWCQGAASDGAFPL